MGWPSLAIDHSGVRKGIQGRKKGPCIGKAFRGQQGGFTPTHKTLDTRPSIQKLGVGDEVVQDLFFLRLGQTQLGTE